MTAHLSDEQVRAYRERTLAAAELLLLSEHLGGCENCRKRIYAPAELSSRVGGVRLALRAAAAGVHISYEEITSYADRTMAADDSERVEAHARECPTCAADLAEIRLLRSEIEGTQGNRQPKKFWMSLLGWRGGLVLAAACAVLVGVIARVPFRQNPTVAQVTPPQTKNATIKDGSRQFVLTAQGQIQGLEGLPDADRTYIEQALSGRPLERAAALQDLNGRGGVLLGAPTQPTQGKLLVPLATVVETQRPTFRWQPIAGALYRVSVFDTAYNEVASSGWISASEWQIPTPLRRAARYSWQIAVRQDSSEFTVPTPPAPEARFRVLGEAEEAKISRLTNQFSGSHLVLGLVYARAGLLDDAEQELRALRDDNPGSAQIAGLEAAVERERRITPEPRPLR